jgi:hypothetical protein
MNAIRSIERAALDAHRAGDTWTMFWEQHGAEVCAAEPQDRQRFARLVRRLLSLVTSGNSSSMEPAAKPRLLVAQQDQPSPSVQPIEAQQ